MRAARRASATARGRLKNVNRYLDAKRGVATRKISTPWDISLEAAPGTLDVSTVTRVPSAANPPVRAPKRVSTPPKCGEKYSRTKRMCRRLARVVGLSEEEVGTLIKGLVVLVSARTRSQAPAGEASSSRQDTAEWTAGARRLHQYAG